MQFANINGITMHYQVIGAENKPLLVFANSLGTDFRIWRDCIVRLAGDYSILMYDKRGHGLSDAGTAPYTMQDHIDDLAGLLDLMGAEQSIICGLSVGGMIAQGLSEHRPDLVKALIMCDTGHKIGTAEMWNERIQTAETKGISAMAAPIMERWFTKDFHEKQKDALAGYTNMLTRTTVAGYAGTCAAIRDTDYTTLASKITVPTLCIVGDQDGSTPPSLVAGLAKLIPGGHFEVIKGSAHLPCIEQPEILVALINAFVRELSLDA
ncbi:MAG: 3-oxoadipate enol-lactonase [Pseudomonadota bacterium]